MPTIIHLTDNAIAVEVPPNEGVSFFLTQIAQQEIDLVWKYKDGGAGFVNLLYAKWSILGKAGEITEEQCKKIVSREYFEDDSEYYHIYEPGDKVRENLFVDTACESFSTLLKAKNVPESSIVLVKDI